MQSHELAVAATRNGEFRDEITQYRIEENVPDLVSCTVMTQAHEVSQKEEPGPSAETSFEALANLRPVFAQNASVTTCNSSQIPDGVAVLLCSEFAPTRCARLRLCR